MKQLKNLILVSLVYSGICFAETLTVTDSQGVVRAEQAVTQGENAAIQFNVSQTTADEPVKVILTNQATGEVLEVAAQNGTALFENIAPGAWTVSSPTAGVTFTSIEITSVAAAGSLAVAGIPGSIVAVGGAGAVATTAAISANNSDEDPEPLSPSS